jgi:hypothetical protein
MYRVTCTGKNHNYGKAGQRRLISNWHYQNTKNEGWYHHAKYAGSGILVIKIIEAEDGKKK